MRRSFQRERSINLQARRRASIRFLRIVRHEPSAAAPRAPAPSSSLGLKCQRLKGHVDRPTFTGGRPLSRAANQNLETSRGRRAGESISKAASRPKTARRHLAVLCAPHFRHCFPRMEPFSDSENSQRLSTTLYACNSRARFFDGDANRPGSSPFELPALV